MVAASFAIRWLLARAHETPYYFPDEYLYPSFARGIATGGVPSVRGETVSFPALLEPLLAAPAWLPGDTQLAYALTQGIHSLVMSLAALVVEGGSVRRVLRSFRVVLGCLAVPILAGAALGLDRVLGYYAVIMA